MKTIVKDGEALGKMTLTPYNAIFTRFSDEGKQRIIKNAIGIYCGGKTSNLACEEREFCDLLNKAVGPSGILALSSTIEGSGTYSWRRSYGIIDMVRETNMILNDGEYRAKVDTILSRNPRQLNEWSEIFDKNATSSIPPETSTKQ